MRERIREFIIQACEELGVYIVKGVLARDHVHMFLSIPSKLSLSDVMQRIKGRSSSRAYLTGLQAGDWGCSWPTVGAGLRSLPPCAPIRLLALRSGAEPRRGGVQGWQPDPSHN